MLISPISNGYTSAKSVPARVSRARQAATSALTQISTDRTTFGAKGVPQDMSGFVIDKVQKAAKNLRDDGQLKELLSKYPIAAPYQPYKVDCSKSFFSAMEGEKPSLSVVYNLEDDYLFSYSFDREDGAKETRTFEKNRKPSITTVERSLKDEDAIITSSFIGREKEPFTMKVRNKPLAFYSDCERSVEKKNTRGNISEYYRYDLREGRPWLYAITRPKKNREEFIVHRGPHAEAVLPSLELARERVFKFINNDCGNEAMEKLKGYVRLLDSAASEGV